MGHLKENYKITDLRKFVHAIAKKDLDILDAPSGLFYQPYGFSELQEIFAEDTPLISVNEINYESDEEFRMEDYLCDNESIILCKNRSPFHGIIIKGASVYNGILNIRLWGRIDGYLFKSRYGSL